MIISLLNSVFTKIGETLASSKNDDRGIGVVEVILILVVLIGLVVIFRDQLTGIANNIFGRIAEDTNAL